VQSSFSRILFPGSGWLDPGPGYARPGRTFQLGSPYDRRSRGLPGQSPRATTDSRRGDSNSRSGAAPDSTIDHDLVVALGRSWPTLSAHVAGSGGQERCRGPCPTPPPLGGWNNSRGGHLTLRSYPFAVCATSAPRRSSPRAARLRYGIGFGPNTRRGGSAQIPQGRPLVLSPRAANSPHCAALRRRTSPRHEGRRPARAAVHPCRRRLQSGVTGLVIVGSYMRPGPPGALCRDGPTPSRGHTGAYSRKAAREG